MKIINKQLRETADINASRGSALGEFLKLVISAVVLLVALFFITGFLVDTIVTRISFETEARLFKALPLPAATPQSAGLSDYDSRMKKIRKILDTLKKNDIVPPLPFHLVLITQKDPNAFAFPGGSIGITTGLLDVLTDDIAIAFVLGHELGHFKNRDHLRGMGRAIGFSVLTAAIFGSSIGADSFGGILKMVIQRRYSQECEKKADRFGLKLVHSVYGTVNGTQRLFEILRDRNKIRRWAYMLATHPSPEERIRDMEVYAKKLAEP
ncbi:MAG: M48 family metallopeptidase [Deltaproteobacteria bacterium]|nr:M48 family metallopeptidase [Deltaproteobacteria bacterium]